MKIDEKSCSGLIGNAAGGNNCKHGHATTASCFGNGYPSGDPVPVCVREDKQLDELSGRISAAKWDGA